MWMIFVVTIKLIFDSHSRISFVKELVCICNFAFGLICRNVLFFFGLLLTTEAMGIGGLRANFLSQSDKRKCGRKDCEMHVSQPMNIGVC